MRPSTRTSWSALLQFLGRSKTKGSGEAGREPKRDVAPGSRRGPRPAMCATVKVRPACSLAAACSGRPAPDAATWVRACSQRTRVELLRYCGADGDGSPDGAGHLRWRLLRPRILRSALARQFGRTTSAGEKNRSLGASPHSHPRRRKRHRGAWNHGHLREPALPGFHQSACTRRPRMHHRRLGARRMGSACLPVVAVARAARCGSRTVRRRTLPLRATSPLSGDGPMGGRKRAELPSSSHPRRRGRRVPGE